MRDVTYPPIIVTAKTAFRALGQRFQMTGTEHVPREGGVLLAFNHVSYVDFVYGGFAANPSGRLVRFMAKREIFDHRWGGPLMRSLHPHARRTTRASCLRMHHRSRTTMPRGTPAPRTYRSDVVQANTRPFATTPTCPPSRRPGGYVPA